jgi:ATP/maltotriose-dependent transcriptional regulator MalT
LTSARRVEKNRFRFLYDARLGGSHLEQMRRTIIIYAIALAVLTFALKFFEYRFIAQDLSIEAYLGIVAVLFTGLGIWAGLKLTRRRPLPKAGAEFTPDELERERLGISKREYEVLELIAQGLSNQEIADKLFVSLNTVKTHSSRIFSKLDARRRTEAIRRAKELRLLP